VKKIRLEQADKQRKINIYLNENRKLFFEKVTPILLAYINELGIEVLLNKDTVALASLGSDITKSAINKINEKLKN
jgi:Skp family chaperone for outer membrane proteins